MCGVVAIELEDVYPNLTPLDDSGWFFQSPWWYRPSLENNSIEVTTVPPGMAQPFSILDMGQILVNKWWVDPVSVTEAESSRPPSPPRTLSADIVIERGYCPVLALSGVRPYGADDRRRLEEQCRLIARAIWDGTSARDSSVRTGEALRTAEDRRRGVYPSGSSPRSLDNYTDCHRLLRWAPGVGDGWLSSANYSFEGTWDFRLSAIMGVLAPHVETWRRLRREMVWGRSDYRSPFERYEDKGVTVEHRKGELVSHHFAYHRLLDGDSTEGFAMCKMCAASCFARAVILTSKVSETPWSWFTVKVYKAALTQMVRGPNGDYRPPRGWSATLDGVEEFAKVLVRFAQHTKGVQRSQDIEDAVKTWLKTEKSQTSSRS